MNIVFYGYFHKDKLDAKFRGKWRGGEAISYDGYSKSLTIITSANMFQLTNIISPRYLKANPSDIIKTVCDPKSLVPRVHYVPYKLAPFQWHVTLPRNTQATKPLLQDSGVGWLYC